MTFPQVEAFRGGENLIRVVGHRGARGVLPENSMIGFDFSLSIGVPLLEFDVVLTADSVPVITHNHRLHAPTFRDADGRFLVGEELKVSSLTVEQMQQFDIGRLDGHSAYGRRFPDQAQMDGVRVPTLMNLLELVDDPKYRDACLMLELKSDPDLAHDAVYRQSFVGRVLQDVRARGLSSRAVLHSFDWNLLEECQRQAPDMPSSYLTQLPDNADDVGEDSSKAVCPDFRGRRDEIPKLVKEAGGALWCPYFADVTVENVVLAKKLGLCVAVWTVNEHEDIDKMIDLGVDAIVSDYPGRVQRHLSDLGIRWSAIH
ncbi:glycerophosphodiester phosphodiesterase family protein [Ruegeria atlantica]|uniref:Putative glycerophosphoryl diester phosphodiesterase 1 n=1 Tax=Ruegeria atlantica TaxID=81569 RepID=A0A0P1EZK0_9RHOB|nr:glycerophosphodiester phosphodiesterase family protein [Ruegeria atlantica]CUH47576.1 putative glycerophosphoryl diester phosphodiesterase 1 [Ruegeria atlantica]